MPSYYKVFETGKIQGILKINLWKTQRHPYLLGATFPDHKYP